MMESVCFPFARLRTVSNGSAKLKTKVPSISMSAIYHTHARLLHIDDFISSEETILMINALNHLLWCYQPTGRRTAYDIPTSVVRTDRISDGV